MQIMKKNWFLAALFASGLSVSAVTDLQYETAIKFYGINSNNPSTTFESTFDTSMVEQGCGTITNFTIIVHGWLEGFDTAWIAPMVGKFSKYRSGCIFVVDYSKFSNVSNYFELVGNFKGIADVLSKKIQQIGNFDRQLCFGFSFGSRLCIEVGLRLGNQSIGQMELCDPAGPGFDMNVDPKPAAKNVACISTSSDKGTIVYNCHQNFRLGICGFAQVAAGPYPLGSHGLCPYMYLSAFENDFVANNLYGCYSERSIKIPTSDVKMGYTASFNKTLYQGDLFIATAQFPPYLVVNNVVYNV